MKEKNRLGRVAAVLTVLLFLSVLLNAFLFVETKVFPTRMAVLEEKLEGLEEELLGMQKKKQEQEAYAAQLEDKKREIYAGLEEAEDEQLKREQENEKEKMQAELDGLQEQIAAWQKEYELLREALLVSASGN